MKITSKHILIALGILYLIPGLWLVWNNFSISHISLMDQLPTLIFLLILWPLVSIAIFLWLAVPGLVIIILAIILLFKRKYAIGLALLFTMVILFGALLNQRIPIEDESHLYFGWPRKYVVQDQSQFEFASVFQEYPDLPKETRFYEAKEVPVTEILWSQFAYSFLIIFLPIFIALAAINKIARNKYF